jgi:hypothetical protein
MIVHFPTAVSAQRRSSQRSEIRNIDAANETIKLAASIAWPELPEPTDYPENEEDLANLEFEGIPEFRPDGYGAGTPEFRDQLEAYFRTVQFASRLAFAVLGFSRRELVEKAGDEVGMWSAQTLADGVRDLMRLTHYVRAAQVRQVCAVVERDMRSESANETA